MAGKSRRLAFGFLIFAALGIAFLPRLMSTIQASSTTVTSTGGNGVWSDPLNWSPNVVPCNTETDTYTIVIGTSEPATVTFDTSCQIDSLTVNAGSTLRRHD